MPVDYDCYEKTVLFLTASGLPRVGLTGKMDAFAVLYQVDPYTHRLTTVGYTEVLKDCADPTWTTSFTLNYHFEAIQEFLVKVFHHDGNTPVSVLAQSKTAISNATATAGKSSGTGAAAGGGSGHTWIGDARFLLSSLMCSASQRLQLPFIGEQSGFVGIKGEVMHHTRDNLIVTFSAQKLRNKEGFFSKSDPFLKISRRNEDGTFTAVWQNDYIASNLNPVWPSVRIPIVQLCNADTDRPIRIQIFDYENSGRHHFMGEVDTTVRQLVDSGALTTAASMEVIEPKKVAKNGKKYINSGVLTAHPCLMEENPTFADFITGGLEINLTVAIDFTASNGDPNSKASLHYFDPTGQLNTYQQAISAVCSVLEPYDSDHMYPVYGFGAKLMDPATKEYGKPQHCFPLCPDGLEVQGIEGIMKAYKECVRSVMLSGPTLFAPLIQAASHRASMLTCSQEKQSYSILLILTDGVINDFDSSKAAIIEASKQPLSIIIVGVGNADFGEMDALDSDEHLLTHNGFTADRDIVQFVSFKEQLMKGSQSLAEAVLAEIPTQLLTFMKQRDIKPNEKK